MKKSGQLVFLGLFNYLLMLLLASLCQLRVLTDPFLEPMLWDIYNSQPFTGPP